MQHFTIDGYMKIGSSASNTLITNNTNNVNQFKIEATGKAFQILSSALYSHKVRAVVREVGCNAWDAHIDANNTDRPFDVTLPTKESPTFTVRDYGIGLSVDSFVHVYTTYFGSTKSGDNTRTGGLGLGSKTPFIMSKLFNVTSFYEGVEYLWQCYVNDNGEPDVQMLLERETTEPNGLKIVVPIGAELSQSERGALIREFAQEASHVYRWFEVAPNIINLPTADQFARWDTGYKSIKLDNGVIAYYQDEHKSTSTRQSIINVKMGNVVYPYDISQVKNLDRFGGKISYLQNILDYLSTSSFLNMSTFPLTLDVPMGYVEFAPSREALSLTNTVELLIMNALVSFIERYLDAIRAEVAAAETPYIAFKHALTRPPFPGFKVKYAGEEITIGGSRPGWNIINTNGSGGSGTQMRPALKQLDLSSKWLRVRRSGRVGLNKSRPQEFCELYGYNRNSGRLVSDTIIVIDKAYKGELREWIKLNVSDDHAQLFIVGDYDGTARPSPLTGPVLKRLLDEGHPNIILFSSFTKVPVPKKTSPSPSTAIKVEEKEVAVLHWTPIARPSRVNDSVNPFTVGNSRVCSVSRVLKGKPSSILVVFARKSGDIVAPGAIPVAGAKNAKAVRSMTKITTYSRAASTTSGSSIVPPGFWTSLLVPAVTTSAPIKSATIDTMLGVADPGVHDCSVDVQIGWTPYADYDSLMESFADEPRVMSYEEYLTTFLPEVLKLQVHTVSFTDRGRPFMQPELLSWLAMSRDNNHRLDMLGTHRAEILDKAGVMKYVNWLVQMCKDHLVDRDESSLPMVLSQLRKASWTSDLVDIGSIVDDAVGLINKEYDLSIGMIRKALAATTLTGATQLLDFLDVATSGPFWHTYIAIQHFGYRRDQAKVILAEASNVLTMPLTTPTELTSLQKEALSDHLIDFMMKHGYTIKKS